MYKILPILLFSVSLLFAIDYSEEIQKHIDFRINDISEEIMIGLNQNIYSIKIEYEVIDTIIVDEIITRENYDSLITSEIKESLAQLRVEIPTTDWLVTLYEIENTPIILLFKFQCNPFIDKQLEYNSELRHHKRQLSTTIENFTWCQEKVDDSSFTFIDIIPTEEHKKSIGQTNNLNRNDIYDDSWAVIIGIDKYKYSDQLNYAVKDAEAVKDMLISKFDYPEENIRYLIDEEATLSNIKLNLGEVATSAGGNDRIVVFYSGHGETLIGKDGTETGYIIPIEGKQDKPYETGLAMDEILRTCQMSDAKHMLFLMDACYSGLMTENVKGLSKPQAEGYLSKVANEKARQIITAGGGDEQVIERDEWQHSAFTKNLLAGLNDWESDTDNDGYVTADELGTYLRKSVTEDSDFQQTPQKGRFRNSGDGEFVFFGRKNIENKDVNILSDKSIEQEEEEEGNDGQEEEEEGNDGQEEEEEGNDFSFAMVYTSPFDVSMMSDQYLLYNTSYTLENFKLSKNMNLDFISIGLVLSFGGDEEISSIGIHIQGNSYIYKENIYLFSSLQILQSKYEKEDENYISKSLNLSPAIGIGFPASFFNVSIGMNYSLNDLKNENNEYIQNGFGGILSLNMSF